MKTYLARLKVSPRQQFYLLFGILLAASVLRFSYYGAQYFFQIDDYMQYYGFRGYDSVWQGIQEMNLLRYRPLAVLVDNYFWTLFYDHMWFASVLLAAAMTGSGAILYVVLRRHFSVSPFFFVIYCLIPLGFEGTYWVSASTRISVGLLLIALSAWLFQRYADRGGPWRLVLSLFLQFCSYSFYEQAIPLSITLTVILAFLNRDKLGRKCALVLLSILEAGLYFLICRLLSGEGEYVRSNMLFPWQEGYLDWLFAGQLEALWEAFWHGTFAMTAKAFSRGLQLIRGARGAVYVLLAAVLSAGFGALVFLRRPEKRESVRQTLAAMPGHLPTLIAGILLLIAPVSILLVSRNPVCLRNTVMSFCGLAMVLDWLLARIWSLVPRVGDGGYALCSASVMLIFLVASVSEVHDYKLTYEADQAVVERIASVYDESKASVAYLNVNRCYLPDQNYRVNQHILGATEARWSLSGAVEAHVQGDPYLPVSSSTPIPGDRGIKPGYEDLDQYDDFYLLTADWELIRVIPEEDDGVALFYDESGDLRCRIEYTEAGNYLYLEALQ